MEEKFAQYIGLILWTPWKMEYKNVMLLGGNWEHNGFQNRLV